MQDQKPNNPDKQQQDPWPVSPARWHQYLQREVELAVENIRRTGSSILSSTDTVNAARDRISIEDGFAG